MRPVWVLTVVGLCVVAGFMAWVVSRSGALAGSWTGGSPHILAAMALGAVGVGALTGGLMWLAFFSARRGYDDRAAEWEEDASDGG